MADAAYKILVSDSKKINGNYFIDDEVLEGLDLTQYSVDPQVSQFDLLPDILID